MAKRKKVKPKDETPRPIVSLVRRRASTEDGHMMAYVGTRRVLTTLVEMMSKMHRDEAREFLGTVATEIELICTGDITAEVYAQATRTLDGLGAYGLERIGMLPKQTSAENANG